ncbi:hypothetical protein AVEN_158344-1 [Araneus ventricosus]|uniref:Uncharacterized protein n=1 Tax=Araneus ventricosus TaxID=182803 RepID=A0A4Y2FFK6_ARAVE|nr:hypothetical protein AVEN_158344-1 [Araneus ventricosus]
MNISHSTFNRAQCLSVHQLAHLTKPQRTYRLTLLGIYTFSRQVMTSHGSLSKVHHISAPSRDRIIIPDICGSFVLSPKMAKFVTKSSKLSPSMSLRSGFIGLAFGKGLCGVYGINLLRSFYDRELIAAKNADE